MISCLVISASSASAATILTLNFNGTTIDTTSGFNVVNSTTDSVLNDVAWSDGVTGTSGVVDISFRVTASNTLVGRTGTGGIGNTNGTLIGNAGTITINNLAVTSVSGNSFTVDGFTSLTFAITAGTGGVYTILAPTPGGNISVPSTGSYSTSELASSIRFDADAGSTMSFTGAGIQLTGVVPEPSAALLGGLGVLLLLRRRR